MPSTNTISIVSYDARYRNEFKRLNEAWISEYFEMEETDHKALDHPEQYIIASGGEILFAVEGDTVAGTCALIRTNDGPFDFELAKMAVDPRFRGRGIGQQLGAAIIDRARKLGAKTIFLESNTILAPAISLYRKLGFVETERQPTTYARGNIHMVLKLESVTELPFNQHVGIRKGSTPGSLVELPAGGQYLNHIGTVHAGAQLVLAEACSGEFLLRNLVAGLKVLPVVRRVEAKFKRPANGRLVANVITPMATIVDAVVTLERKGRCLVTIAVEIIDESGQITLAASFDWFIAQSPNATSPAGEVGSMAEG